MKCSFCVVKQDGLSGMESAHAMHAASGRGGGGAEKKARVWRAMRARAGDGAGKELLPIGDAADDIASDVVGIMGFHLPAVVGACGEDGVLEAGGKTFDLAFDPVTHIQAAAVRDVAVGPKDVFSCGCAGGVAKGGLSGEDKRFLAMDASTGLML